MNIVIGPAIGSAALIYEIIAVFGYLTFGSAVCASYAVPADPGTDDSLQVGPNIIAMYPSTSLFIAVGQLAIVILVMFFYPKEEIDWHRVFQYKSLTSPVMTFCDLHGWMGPPCHVYCLIRSVQAS